MFILMDKTKQALHYCPGSMKRMHDFPKYDTYLERCGCRESLFRNENWGGVATPVGIAAVQNWTLLHWW